MRSTLITLALVVTALITSACNTMQGMGEDIEAGGKKLQSSAKESSY